MKSLKVQDNHMKIRKFIVMGDAFLLLRKLWGFLPVDNLAHNHRLDESVRPRAKEVVF